MPPRAKKRRMAQPSATVSQQPRSSSQATVNSQTYSSSVSAGCPVPIPPAQAPANSSVAEAQPMLTRSSGQSLALPTPGTLISTSADVGTTPVSVPSVHMIGTNVSSTIKQRIIGGQYIDLATLVTPKSGSDEKKLVINSMGEIISKDLNSKKVENIEQWTDLMLIFASVYLSAHPAKTLDLFKYIQTVRMGVSRGAISWKEYDTQFRLRKEQNPSSSWGEVDSELWLMYMHSGPAYNVTNEPKTNNGKCYNFNFKGSCDKFPCTYKHSCLRCGSNHPLIHCITSVQAPNTGSAQTFRQQNSNGQFFGQSGFRTQTTNANTNYMYKGYSTNANTNYKGYSNSNTQRQTYSRPRFRSPQSMASRFNSY
ncbi:uncharacterized protein LOC134279254 [Saccostrea cucullata]|uniref:uncharacterized protein LOC134279254 n=1 Tax=Saccostrea cuccullata TaxID=36930 RepID=UPI002ED19E6E